MSFCFDQSRAFFLRLSVSAPLIAYSSAAISAPQFFFDETEFNTALAAATTGAVTTNVDDFESFGAGLLSSSFNSPDTGFTYFTDSVTQDSFQDVLGFSIFDGTSGSIPSTSGFKALRMSRDEGNFVAREAFGREIEISIDLGNPVHAFSGQLVILNAFTITPTDLELVVGSESTNITVGAGEPIDSFASSRFFGVIDTMSTFQDIGLNFGSSAGIGDLDDTTAYDVTITPGTGPMPPVPVPAALPLLATALAGLFLMRRRTGS